MYEIYESRRPEEGWERRHICSTASDGLRRKGFHRLTLTFEGLDKHWRRLQSIHFHNVAHDFHQLHPIVRHAERHLRLRHGVGISSWIEQQHCPALCRP